ncbi:polysaccharide deacetylase family protein [Gracilimonas halophila]|uniref:Polysaccharide deacetylase family protein n=1 Tax=Gracilimonas halophila TaxID=1834464 RepID=A0ABW5JGL1_9BACT
MSKPEVQVFSTPGHIAEKKYIFNVLIEDFLNLSYSFEVSNESSQFLIRKGNSKIIIPDIFFTHLYKEKTPESPNTQEISVQCEQLIDQILPAWFVQNESDSLNITKNSERLPVDVIGMAFFLLSGYADIHFSEQDEHLRYKGKTSFVVKNNLIDRPIIQEWFLVIANLLYGVEKLKPRKQIPAYSKHVSHDVDQPFEYLDYTRSRLLKRILGDLLIRRNVNKVKKRYRLYRAVKTGNYNADPYNNFSEIIDILKANDIKSTFFFVSGKNESEHDVLYNIEHQAIKNIIKRIHKAGHLLGLHPSYNTLHSPELLREEVQKLQNVCDVLDLQIEINATRKHYLRWDWHSTAKDLQDAGIKHDYTVGYADRSGYRTGVAFPYRGFDWKEKKSLDIKLHPLIVMEASLLSDKYMGLSLEQAEEKLVSYHNQLKRLGGEYVVLWHNNRLVVSQEMKSYKKLLSLQ